MSFSRQFLLVSAALLLLAMVVTGNWLAMEIERSAVNRATAVAAVYVESILAAQLRHATTDALLTDDAHEVLDGIFIEGPLRRKVMRFKLWDAEGVIRYSSDHVQQGRRFPVDGLLAAAFGGAVQARISGLDEDDNLSERAYWPRLLEVYVPVRAAARGEVVAVAEFYHSTENIDREILAAQQRIWILVAVATLAIYLLLLTLVRRANDTIVQQRDDLCRQLQQLRGAFEENERMRTRLGEAGAATTTLNEHLLHRIAADLHDGPAQTLAFSLMRFDERTAHCSCADRTACETSSELHAIRSALRSSLDDLRNIAAGLGLPGITDLSLADTARRAVRDFERRTDVQVEVEVDEALRHAGLATKITVYRLLQESLSNSARHAPGTTPQVRVWPEGDQVRIEVSDRGAGFDPAAAARCGRLGLAFMQERVRLLGGHFEVESAPGCGTHVRASLPLAADEARHD